MKQQIIVFALAVSFGMSAQQESAPAIEWKKCLGGGNHELANSVRQTADGGYVVAGYAYSSDSDVSGIHGGSDFWIVKLSALGAIQWQKCYGGTGDDQASSVRQTADGGYIVAGYTNSINGDVTMPLGNWDYWVLKLDGNGNLLWQKTYGGSKLEAATGIEQTTDGGYIISGYTASSDGQVTNQHYAGRYDAWAVKIDGTGNLQWQQALGGENYDNGYDTKQTTDGGYILACYTSSGGGQITQNYGGGDYWIVKLDASGTMEWQKSFGGSDWDVPNSIVQTPDGGYLVSGFSQSTDGNVTGNHGIRDAWVIRLSPDGMLQWQRCYGGTYYEGANSISITADGGFVLAGYSNSNDGDVSGFHGTPGSIIGGTIAGDYWMLKADENGNIKWQKTMGGFYNDQATSIAQTADSGFVMCGSVLATAAASGDIQGFHYNATLPNASGRDFWVVKLSAPVLGTDEFEKPWASASPNPFGTGFKINVGIPDGTRTGVKIYDMSGRMLYNHDVSALQLDGLIFGSDYLSGVYNVTVTQGENVKMIRIIKQ